MIKILGILIFFMSTVNAYFYGFYYDDDWDNGVMPHLTMHISNEGGGGTANANAQISEIEPPKCYFRELDENLPKEIPCIK